MEGIQMMHPKWTASLLVLTLAGCDSNDPNQPTPVDELGLPVGHVNFTHLPIDLENAIEFIGYGELNIIPKGHGGFAVKGWSADRPSDIPIYAPADGVITVIDQFSGVRPNGDKDMAITIQISTTIRVRWGHVDDIAQSILDQLSKPLVEGENRPEIRVNGGDQVGWVGQWPGFDTGIEDRGLELPWANPARYKASEIYWAYPFDYWRGNLAAQMLAITRRQVEPRGGRIVYDVPGRIIGNWFHEELVPPLGFLPFSGHLAIAYEYFQAANVMISEAYGRADPDYPSRELLDVINDPTPPEELGVDDGLIKYEYVWDGHIDFPARGGTMLLQLVSPSRLRVERFEGSAADEVEGFTASSRYYIR